MNCSGLLLWGGFVYFGPMPVQVVGEVLVLIRRKSGCNVFMHVARLVFTHRLLEACCGVKKRSMFFHTSIQETRAPKQHFMGCLVFSVPF